MSSRIELTDLPPRYQAQALQQMQTAQKARKLKQQMEEPVQKARAGNKYGAQPTEVNGIKFDSKKEARRYEVLMMAQEMEWIEDLRLQVDYTLQEAFTRPDGTRVRSIKYVADFVYRVGKYPPDPQAKIGPEDRHWWGMCGPGAEIIEDVKSRATRTRQYIIKAKLMEDHGHHIREV